MCSWVFVFLGPRPFAWPLALALMIIIITGDAFAAARSVLNGPYNIFDEKVKSCFSKFVNIMVDVFLISEAAFIFKECF